MEKAKRIGIDAYKAELDEKVCILKTLLEKYDDGRRKSFYCLAINLLELEDIKIIMGRIADEIESTIPIKEQAKIAVRLFEEIAELRNVSLKLRKKSPLKQRSSN
jgi:hypothetical protein